MHSMTPPTTPERGEYARGYAAGLAEAEERLKEWSRMVAQDRGYDYMRAASAVGSAASEAVRLVRALRDSGEAKEIK